MYELRSGYEPGAIGRVTELHGRYYAASWQFGQMFEGKVAAELAQFFGRFNPRQDGFWTAQLDGKIEGSITIDGSSGADRQATLRWFIVAAALRGRGAGAALLDQALGFCAKCGYSEINLWTFAGLDTAQALYRKRGFVLARESRGARWGTEVTEQQYVLKLPGG